MTQEKLIDAITDLDSDILNRYFDMKADLAAKKKPKKRTWVKWASVAACLVLMVGAIVIVPHLFGDHFPSIFPPYGSPSEGDAAPGLEQTTFGFDSYEEMIQAFRKHDLIASTDTIQGLKASLGESYTRFVDQVNQNRAFAHPMLNGEPIELRNEEGFSSITFFVSELYHLPWIWYFPSVPTGENFYIAVTYLPESILEMQQSMTASEVIQTLAPNAPNVNNLGSSHKAIYNQAIALGDREVTALIIEYQTDTRNSIFFVYDDLLVRISADSAVWDDAWFSLLTFDAIKP